MLTTSEIMQNISNQSVPFVHHSNFELFESSDEELFGKEYATQSSSLALGTPPADVIDQFPSVEEDADTGSSFRKLVRNCLSNLFPARTQPEFPKEIVMKPNTLKDALITCVREPEGHSTVRSCFEERINLLDKEFSEDYHALRNFNQSKEVYIQCIRTLYGLERKYPVLARIARKKTMSNEEDALLETEESEREEIPCDHPQLTHFRLRKVIYLAEMGKLAAKLEQAVETCAPKRADERIMNQKKHGKFS